MTLSYKVIVTGNMEVKGYVTAVIDQSDDNKW